MFLDEENTWTISNEFKIDAMGVISITNPRGYRQIFDLFPCKSVDGVALVNGNVASYRTNKNTTCLNFVISNLGKEIRVDQYIFVSSTETLNNGVPCQFQESTKAKQMKLELKDNSKLFLHTTNCSSTEIGQNDDDNDNELYVTLGIIILAISLLWL